MVGDHDEAVTNIEAGSDLVDSVHHDEARGSSLTGGNGLAKRLAKEQGTETMALVASVDGKSRQQDHADRTARHAADERRGCLGSLDGAHGEAEVADDTFTIDQHEGTSNVHLLGGDGVDMQPAVEALVAGGKPTERVVEVEPLQAATGHVSGNLG